MTPKEKAIELATKFETEIITANGDYWKEEINKFLSTKNMSILINNYETGNFMNSDLTKDLQRRFCFDIFCAAKLPSHFISDFYKYGNDEHLYTALKMICPKITRKY